MGCFGYTPSTRAGKLLTALLLLGVAAITGAHQSQAQAIASRVSVSVDTRQRTTLHGTLHPLSRPESDRGALPDNQPMNRMLLLLTHSSQQTADLEKLLQAQQDKHSSSYKQWLTPQQFGKKFGPSEEDVQAITGWLSSQGFTGIKINDGRTVIEFSGTAGSVRQAFGTEMHQFSVNGAIYTANASEVQIPTALAPVVAGIASLNNFPRTYQAPPTATFHRDTTTGKVVREAGTGATPQYTAGTGVYALTPTDVATIYNALPLWNASTPINGTGQTIAVVGDSDISAASFVAFRQLFNLPIGNTTGPTGTQYLNILVNGPDPGAGFDAGEGDIDTQWAGALAEGATIDYVESASTETTSGLSLSVQYIVDNNLAPVMTVSYGNCEAYLGASGNTFLSSLYQQAAAQGVTVVVSSGDSGSAGCNLAANTPSVREGMQVNGMASTPYNVAVGGTDFNLQSGTYFSSTNDPVTYASALGYIPEITWNSSCGNPVIPTWFSSFAGETAEQVCNSSTQFLNDSASGGGPSSCIGGVSSCTGGYAKPIWQTGTGVPADSVRDIPDVSFFGGSLESINYAFCTPDVNCTTQFVGGSGTSFSAPVFASMMALVNQSTGNRQGNANYTLYNLANAQSAASPGTCNASTTPGSSCLFNDITVGSNTLPCTSGSPNCVVTTTGDTYGLLSGYNAGVGYDETTGLGSVNIANLVNGWNSTNYVATNTSLTLGSTSVVHGTAVSANIAVTSSNGIPTGSYAIVANTTNGAIANGLLSNGLATTSVSNLPGGSYLLTADYAGDGVFAPSSSTGASVTVTPESSTTTFALLGETTGPGVWSTIATAPYGTPVIWKMTVAGASGKGIPTGTIAFNTAFGFPTSVPNSLGTGTYSLNSQGVVEYTSSTMPVGLYELNATYSGDASFNTSAATQRPTSISKRTPKMVLTPSNTTVTFAAPITLSVAMDAASSVYGSFGAPMTGNLELEINSVIVSTIPVSNGTSAYYGSQTGLGSFTITTAMLSATTNTIYVIYTGDANYATTNTFIYLTAQKTTPTLTLTGPSPVAAGSPAQFNFAVTPTSPQATGTATYLVDNKTPGTTLTLSGGAAAFSIDTTGFTAGTHSVYVYYSGDGVYNSGYSNFVSLGVIGNQTITFPQPTSPVGYLAGANETLTATASSGLPVTYTITSGPATISGSKITFTGTGVVEVTATQTGSTYYNAAAPVSVYITVLAGQTITFTAPPTVEALGNSLILAATSTSGLPVSFAITSGSATLSGNTATFGTLGSVIVTATQAGNAMYGAATPVSYTVSVEQPQTISFTPLPSSPSYYSAASLTLSATATSGLPVTFSVLSGPATVSGTTLVLTGAGSIVVAANQVGNGTYAPANTMTQTITAVGGQASYSFAATPVGTAATPQTATVQFSQAATLNASAAIAVQVASQGTAGLDFSQLAISSDPNACVPGMSYASGQSCDVGINFTPKYPGTRTGAITLYSNDATPLLVATVFINGTGTAPQGQFLNGAVSSPSFAGNGIVSSQGVPTVDSVGNLYVISFTSSGNSVYKLAPGCQSASCEVAVGSGWVRPYSIAVDGAGNVFVADYGVNRDQITEVPYGCTTSACQIVVSPTTEAETLAADSFGNVYYYEYNYPNNVVEIPAGCQNTTCQKVLYTYYESTGMYPPEQMTVDPGGNLYFTSPFFGNARSGSIDMIAAGTHAFSTAISGLGVTYGVTSDAFGNLYVGDVTNGVLYQFPVGCRSTNCANIVTNTLGAVMQLAVAPNGTIYADTGVYGLLSEIQQSQYPAINFPTTATNGTSAAQSLVFQNIGNAPLDFSSISASTGFSSVGTTCSSSASLAQNALCNVSVAFTPVAPGAITGTLTVTDDSWNISGSTSTVTLNGTATGFADAVVISASPNTGISYGTSVTLTAQLSPTTYQGYTATGSFLFAAGGVTLCSGVSFNASGIATCTTTAISGGSPNVTATYSGDSNFAPATGTLALNIAATSQTITFPSPLSPVAFSSNPLTLAATSSSGLAVSYSVSGPATLSGSTLTYTGTGTVTITASQAGNAQYTAATPVAVTVQVLPTPATYTFPTATIGTPSSSQQVSVTFFSNTTLNPSAATAIQALTQGSAVDLNGNPLDFALASTQPSSGACSAAATYSIGNTCSVNVIFTPRGPGLRSGAVVLFDNTGIAVATAYMSGSGNGPQATFNGAVSNVPIQMGTGIAIAVDGGGNIYTTYYNAGGLIKMPLGCADSTCQVSIPSSLGGSLYGSMVVDAAGTLYVADDANHRVIKVPAGCVVTACQSVVLNSLGGSLTGVTTDAYGNLYASGKDNAGYYNVQKMQPNGVPVEVAQTNLNIYNLAVDPTGDLFEATGYWEYLQESAPSCYVFACMTNTFTLPEQPIGVAIDGVGNIYSSGYNAISEIPAGCTSNSCVVSLAMATSYPQNIALDPVGNYYYISQGAYKGIRTQGSLSFGTVSVGATTAEQSVTMTNSGNQPLNITSIASNSANYAVAGDSTCTAGTLAVGASCTINMVFAPLTGGPDNGAIQITSNNLASAGSVQSIFLSGTATLLTTTTTLATPAPASVLAGQTTTLTATLSPASVSTESATGSITFRDNAVVICPGVAFNNVGIAQCATSALTAGSHNFTATYSGDANFKSSLSSTQSMTVLGTNIITFPTLSSQVVFGDVAPLSLNATASSTLAVLYAVTGPATLNSGVLNITGPGAITVTASQPGNSAYPAATPVVQTFISLPANFAAVGTATQAQGSTSTVTVTLQFNAIFTLSSLSVLSSGASGAPFTVTSGGSCQTGTQYNAGSSCTVALSYTPTGPGLITGTVEAFDTIGLLQAATNAVALRNR